MNKFTLVLWMIICNFLAMISNSMSLVSTLLLSVAFWAAFFYWFDKTYVEFEKVEKMKEEKE